MKGGHLSKVVLKEIEADLLCRFNKRCRSFQKKIVPTTPRFSSHFLV